MQISGFEALAKPAAVDNKFSFLVEALNLKEISSEFVVVNVWSPSCEPCGKEVNELNQISSQEVRVLGLPIDGRKKEAEEFILHFKPRYQQVYLDADSKKQLFEVGKIPYTILFNKKRNLVQEWAGTITASDLILAVAKQERPVK